MLVKNFLKNLFAEKALSEQGINDLEKEIQFTAQRLGFSLVETNKAGRIFYRKLGDTTVSVPHKDNFTNRTSICLHEFDCWL